MSQLTGRRNVHADAVLALVLETVEVDGRLARFSRESVRAAASSRTKR